MDSWNDLGNHGNFNKQLGIRITDWRDGYCRLTLDADAQYLNRSGYLHGGLSMTLLDVAGGYCGCWCTVPGNKRLAVTISLTCNFLQAGSVGALSCEAWLTGGGASIFFTEQKLFDPRGRVIAAATASYKRRRNSLTPEGFTPG